MYEIIHNLIILQISRVFWFLDAYAKSFSSFFKQLVTYEWWWWWGGGVDGGGGGDDDDDYDDDDDDDDDVAAAAADDDDDDDSDDGDKDGGDGGGWWRVDIDEVDSLLSCVCQMASQSPRQAATTKNIGSSSWVGPHEPSTSRVPALKTAPEAMMYIRLMCLATWPMAMEVTELTAPKDSITKPIWWMPSAQLMYDWKGQKEEYLSGLLHA